MTFYSEYGQDRWLAENVFQGVRNGTFVEAGALDGITDSNTLYFEREMGWRGVLVEANPTLFGPLYRNRFSESTETVSCALGAHHCGERFDVSEVAGWSGLARILHPRRTSRARVPFFVEVRTLAAVLEEHHLTAVDYLSLDVEGAELEVLSAYPFDEIPIRVIGVEDNDGNNEPLRQLLIDKGYRHLARVGVDEFWQR